MAKTKKTEKTIEQLERELSPEGVKLAKQSYRAIKAMSRATVEANKSPERVAINELVQAYAERS